MDGWTGSRIIPGGLVQADCSSAHGQEMVRVFELGMLERLSGRAVEW